MDNKIIKVSKKGNDGHTNISIRLRDDILNELNSISTKTNRSRNELVNLFLEFSVKNWGLEEELHIKPF